MSTQAKSSLLDVLLRTWYLGVTSFGGPVVHFQIFHRKFVEGQDPWLDEQTVRYLPSASSVPGLMIFSFAVSGAFCDLSGPSRSSQHEVRILHSTRKGRIFGSCHVFPDLEVSSLSSRQSIYHWAFFACHVLFVAKLVSCCPLYNSSRHWNVLSRLTVSV